MKLLTTKEAAAYLKEKGVDVKTGTMNVWRSAGKGPRYRIVGDRWVRYAPPDLDAFSNGQIVETIDTRG